MQGKKLSSVPGSNIQAYLPLKVTCASETTTIRKQKQLCMVSKHVPATFCTAPRLNSTSRTDRDADCLTAFAEERLNGLTQLDDV